MNKKASIAIPLSLFALLFLLSGCCQIVSPFDGSVWQGLNITVPPIPSLPGQEREWTYIVYMNGDNTLEMPAIMDFLEMEGYGSTDKIAIVVQFDRSKKYFSQDQGAWVGARRYYVQKGNGDYIVSPVLEDLGNTDMSKGSTLADFANWAIANYPAKHYALVMWDHGGGWTGMSQDETSGSTMSLVELKNGLGTIGQGLGRKLDVVVFDMCLMAQYDVMLDVAPYADYAVASEEIVPGYSFNYTSLMAELNSEPQLTPERFAELEVQDFGEYYQGQEDATTMAAIDLSKMPAVESAFNDFITALSPRMQKNWNDVAGMERFSEYYAMGSGEEQIWSFADLYDFSRVASAYAYGDSGFAQKAGALQNAINDAVIANYHHRLHPNSHGLSYYFQPSRKLYQQYGEKDYVTTTAYSNPIWRGFLTDYYSRENMSGTAPAITDFKVSATASLARPVRFSYTMSGSNIVHNQWAQFYDDGGTWKLARYIEQRAKTALPDGSPAYGFTDGVGYGVGRSMPLEFGISDGTKTVKASVQQRWPAEDFFVVDGTVRKAGGSEFEAQMYFSTRNGYAVKLVSIGEENGQRTLTPVLAEDGDVFTPYIYFMGQNGLDRAPGDGIVYTDANGLQLSWRALAKGDYVVADVLTDLEGKSSMKAGKFSVEKQPQITAPTEAELEKDWNCGVLDSGLMVNKIMSLSLSRDSCLFQDGAGVHNCSFYYSQAGDPHIYIHNADTQENYKFLVSKRDESSLWLYELAGTDPIICISRGSSAPTAAYYKDLYASIGDPGNDIDEMQTGASALVGTWADQAGGMELKLNNDGSFQWKISRNTISGTYRVQGDTLFLDASSPSSQYSANFTFAVGKKRMVLLDQSLSEISLVKSGADISASNEPVLQEEQAGVPQTPSQPSQPSQPAAPPAEMAGVWINNNYLLSLWLKPDGSYEFSNGYGYAMGTYAVSGDRITFTDYYGNVNQYQYQLSGSSLSLTDQSGTVVLYRYQ